MALTHGEKNGSASGAEPPAPKSASKPRWFNNFLSSASGLDSSYNIMTSSTSSFGQGSEDIEAEAAIEVGEDLELDDRRLNLAFNCRRHLEDIEGSDVENQTWRMRERMKTVSVALVVCLNIGIDPPDVMKTRPCAKVECWVDPNTLNSQRAGESIGSNLQKQYERWQPRARYRLVLDPTVDEVRRLATGLRRNARDERVLFHYNGHGVPKPTANGEIWVFNRNFTQYIPLSLYELQSWMGSPSIFVYDCSNAGIIVSFFEQFAEQHEKEYLDQVNAQGVPSSELSNPISPRSCIQLAACSANQILPMHPDLPADLFTSCLTTPIKMALRWFVMQNQGKLSMKITLDMIDKIPGQFGDRRTMLGELNWIFTAITDTIAWNTLQRPLFQRLFRQDLLVASLFRNFLLAERVMRSYDCAPVSQPALPPTHQHPMWQAWDLAVDIAVSQLPDILEKGATYKSSTFFEEELTAFEVWLKYGNEQRPPPEQLPVVLQVLLSQAHRLRALDLLGRFLDLGPWAVNLALSVGIFPYVLKLLQSSARELKPLLVEIWAKILAVDSSCQSDLVRDGSQKYFVSVLQDECMMPVHRTWATFILACLVQNCRPGQQEAEQTHLIAICIEHLEDKDPVFRQWLAILLGRMWDHYEPARWRGARDNAPERLYELLKDPVPEVRAAAVFALGTFINSCDERSEQANNLDHAIANHLLKACDDGSPLVRCELIVALQYVVRAFEPNFVNVCRAAAEEEELTKQGQYSKTLSQASSKQKSTRGLSTLHPSSSSSCLDSLVSHMPMTTNRSAGSLLGSMPGSSSVSYVYSKVYSGLVFLANDPHIEVSTMGSKIVEYIKLKAKDKAIQEASRAAQLECSSMPSSPSRLSFVPPPRHHQTGVATIAEESSEALSSSADNRSSGSYNDSRLRRGRSEGRHPSGGQHSNASPQNSNTNLTSTTNASSNGLRKVAALNSRSIVPPQLDTSFISWSAKYFTKPQPKHDCFNNDSCDCDVESIDHLRREWMFTRNSELRNEGEVQNELLRDKRGRIDGPISTVGAPTVFRNPQQFIPGVLQFHPFSDEIVVAGQSSVTVWNTKLSRRISAFDINENRILKTHDSISAIEFLNSHDETLLMVGTDDGGIRIYKDYAIDSCDDDSKSDDEDADFHMYVFNRYRIVSAWNGLKDSSGFSSNSFHRHGSLTSFLANMNISKTNPGLRTAWSQVDMTLAVTGAESRYISLWDVNTELRRSDLYTSTGAAVTSIAFGPSHLGLLCAGFTDGSVRVFDVRSPDSRVTLFEGLAGNVLDCKLKGDPQRSSPLLIAGDSSGAMHYHELRMANSHRRSSSRLANFSVTNPGTQVTGLAIHQTADVFAAWAQQSVSMYHFNPLLGSNTHNLVNVIKCHDEGVLGKGIGFEGCLSLHPHLLQVAIGSRDGAISLKAFKKF